MIDNTFNKIYTVVDSVYALSESENSDIICLREFSMASIKEKIKGLLKTIWTKLTGFLKFIKEKITAFFNKTKKPVEEDSKIINDFSDQNVEALKKDIENIIKTNNQNKEYYEQQIKNLTNELTRLREDLNKSDDLRRKESDRRDEKYLKMDSDLRKMSIDLNKINSEKINSIKDIRPRYIDIRAFDINGIDKTTKEIDQLMTKCFDNFDKNEIRNIDDTEGIIKKFHNRFEDFKTEYVKNGRAKASFGFDEYTKNDLKSLVSYNDNSKMIFGDMQHRLTRDIKVIMDYNNYIDKRLSGLESDMNDYALKKYLSLFQELLKEVVSFHSYICRINTELTIEINKEINYVSSAIVSNMIKVSK